MEEETIKILALKGIEGYGNKRVLELIRSYGNVDRAFSIMIDKQIINEEDIRKYELIVQESIRSGIRIITYFNEIYPSKLKSISSPPLVLFTKGNLELLKMPSISIVGTREASEASLKWAYQISKNLSELGYIIVSGGAIGPDSVVHRGALDSTGKTICVLGSGLKNIYPKRNQKLIEEIFEKGLVITEALPNQHVSPISLLERNRITSGLGDKVILVATKTAGGTMSQYKVAVAQKKEIFCTHPDLGLEPNDGIKHIIQKNKKIRVIYGIKDILEPKSLGNCDCKALLNHLLNDS